VRGKIRKSVLMLALIASMLSLTFATPAFAQPPATLAASEIEDLNLTPGTTFVANITIDDVAGMLGYQFWLSWDPHIITATSYVSLAPFVLSWSEGMGTGLLWMVYTYGDLPEERGLTTTTPRTVASITFTVVGTGYSQLDLYDTVVMPVTGAPIEHEVVDGYFVNEAVTRRADLVKRRAYAEHNKWFYGKGTDNSLRGIVKNFGNLPTNVKVEFYLSDGINTVTLVTAEDTVQPGKTRELSVTLTFADMWAGYGHYTWTAQAFYDADGDGIIDTAGTKTKTQGLTFAL